MKKIKLTAIFVAVLIGMAFFVSSAKAEESMLPPNTPAFMQNVKSQADFDKLTPEQKQQAADFLKTQQAPVKNNIQPGAVQSAPPANPQTITVATVNIYDAQIASQENNKINITFDLSNREQIQPDVRYAVQLIKQDKEVQTQMDEKVYPETVTLAENQTLKKEISYTAPQYLSGEFQIWLTAKNQNGMTLALANPGKITLNGDNQFVELNNCYLKVEGEEGDKKYTLTQGVDIKPEEKLISYCDATNHANNALSFTPQFITNFRTTFGQEIKINAETQPILTLNPQETKQLYFAIPKPQAPQAYDAILTLQNLQNNVISNKTTFHYVLHGLSATIQNLRLDKDYYAQGDTAKASFFWSASADNFSGSRLGATDNGTMLVNINIKNQTNQICANLQKELDQNSAVVNFDLPISITCANPQLSVGIQDDKGNILNQENFQIQSQNLPVVKEKQSNVLKVGVALALALLAMFVLAIVIKHRRGTTVIIFLILAGGMFFGRSGEVRADTFYAGDNGNSATGAHNLYTVSLNKVKYLPGENVVASGQGSWSWCNNTGGSVALKVTINGQTKQIFNSYISLRIKTGYIDYNSETLSIIPVASSEDVYVEAYTGSKYFLTGEHGTIDYELAKAKSEGYTCSGSNTSSFIGMMMGGGYTFCDINMATNNILISSSISAQSVAGNYSAVFSGCNGFESNCTGNNYQNYSMPYTVTDPPSVELSANPATINKGAQTTLTWKSANAEKCYVAKAGYPDVFGSWKYGADLNGSASDSPESNQLYYVICHNKYGVEAKAQVDVVVTDVAPTLTATLTANPATINTGVKTDLAAAVTGGTATGDIEYLNQDCGSDNDNVGNITAKTTNGTFKCDYPAPGTYTATAYVKRQNIPVPTSTTITVTDPAPVCAAMGWNPGGSIIPVAGFSTVVSNLTWLTPTNTTSYTLNCDGITKYDSGSPSWTSASGSLPFAFNKAGKETCTIKATGSGGTIDCPVSVDVNIPGKCGLANGKDFSYSITNWGVSPLDGKNYNQCDSGTPNSTAFPAAGGGLVTWKCQSVAGDSDCSASRKAALTCGWDSGGIVTSVSGVSSVSANLTWGDLVGSNGVVKSTTISCSGLINKAASSVLPLVDGNSLFTFNKGGTEICTVKQITTKGMSLTCTTKLDVILCGAAGNGTPLAAKPTNSPANNLCSDNSNPTVLGGGPWSWTCGTNTTCTAAKACMLNPQCTNNTPVCGSVCNTPVTANNYCMDANSCSGTGGSIDVQNCVNAGKGDCPDATISCPVCEATPMKWKEL